MRAVSLKPVPYQGEAMPEPEWGVKRACLSCGARFYDLKNDPATCPECGATFSIDQLSMKRGRADRSEAKAAAKPVPAPDIEADILDDEDDDIEVGDDLLEEDEDDDTVPIEDIGDRAADDSET
jgi:uncharacterized protein (TIGR02300 family)